MVYLLKFPVPIGIRRVTSVTPGVGTIRTFVSFKLSLLNPQTKVIVKCLVVFHKRITGGQTSETVKIRVYYLERLLHWFKVVVTLIYYRL